MVSFPRLIPPKIGQYAMSARTRKLVCYSALVLTLLGLLAFGEQSYRLYRSLRGDTGPAQRGPLPPGFEQKFRDLDMAVARVREHRVRDLQVVLAVLIGFILFTSAVAYFSRARKQKPGDAVLPPVRLGWLWVVPLFVVPGGLIGLLWLTTTIVELSRKPAVAQEPPNAAAANKKGTPPIAASAKPEPVEKPGAASRPAIELTTAQEFTFVGKTSLDCSVYGLRLGMTPMQVEAILTKVPQVRYVPGRFESSVFEPTADGRADEKKQLLYLIWNEPGTELAGIQLHPDMQLHLKGEARRLLTSDVFDDQSDFKRRVLGKADQVAPGLPGETRHVYQSLGISVTEWSTPKSKTYVFVLYKPISASTRQEVRFFEGHTSGVGSLGFTPDSQVLISADDKTIRYWEMSTGKQLRSWEGHKGSIYGMRLSLNGQTLVSNGTDKVIRFWDVATGGEQRQLEIGDGFVLLALSFDGKQLATADNVGGIRLWDTTTGKNLGQVSAEKHVTRLDYLGNQKLVWTTREQVVVWNLATSKQLKNLADATALACSPDGKTVLLSTGYGRKKARLLDTETGAERILDQGYDSIDAAAFGSQGKLLALGLGSDDGNLNRRPILLFEGLTGLSLARLKGHRGGVMSGGIYTLVFSPDGKTLCSAGDDKVIRVWDVELALKSGRAIK